MVRGIMANQLSLDTTGHNITNAGTEGYSRQVVTLATTYAEQRSSLLGKVVVGTGVDALAVNRARNVYADIQYWNENPDQQYYKTLSVNYDKLETVFDDSRDLGIEDAMNKFYRTWVDLSTTASNSSSRTHVIEQGRELSDRIQSATAELQEQIRSEYKDLESELKQVDDILEEITLFNKQIITQEVGGAQANDLRDRRDYLVDQLSDYLNISVSENQFGAYQINSGGVTLVNGPSRAHLIMSTPVSSAEFGIDYGVTDQNIKVKESNIVFIPQSGILKARFDAIAEDKEYIDKMADMASFLLSTFNEQHKQGWDLDGDKQFVDADGNTVSDVTETSTDLITVDGTTYTRVGDTGEYQSADGTSLFKVPNTINFFGQTDMTYEYRYDPENDFNYLYKYDSTLPENERLLSGVRIIDALEVNVKFNEERGYRYLATATSKQYVETAAGEGTWENFDWGDRTGDGTNAVYISELFNISMDTIISDGKANAEVYSQSLLRDKEGNLIDNDGNRVDEANAVYATAMSKLSINSFYQNAMSYLGINAYSTDVNYEALQNVITQVQNWRDSTSGVDWNEELTNMIKFQKGFSSCSRCLTAMDEMLDRLINSTGVVGR